MNLLHIWVIIPCVSLPHISRTTKIILIGEFVLLAYMLYVLSTSLYKSYQVDRFIDSVEQENKQLEEENKHLIEDYEYYRSDAYKEKIAKQNFGIVRPGEEVIVLSSDTTNYLTPVEQAAEQQNAYYHSLSNPKKWFLFFFDADGLKL